jgi:long-chain acyl-CoA synthetase
MSPEDRLLLEYPTAKQVWDWLAGRYADQRLMPDTSPQLDLGIDSLEWLNLTLEIRQRAGVELSEAAISRIDTVRDLLREVSQAASVSEVAVQSLPLEQPEAALDAQQKSWLEPLDPIRSALAWGMYSLNRLLLRALFRLRVQGLEHLPQQPPFVLAPSHVSFLDPPTVAAALSDRCLRQTYWAGATTVIRHNPLIYWISRLAQTVPIDPD